MQTEKTKYNNIKLFKRTEMRDSIQNRECDRKG